MAKWTAEDWDRSENAEEMLRSVYLSSSEGWDVGQSVQMMPQALYSAKLSERKLRLFTYALCSPFREYYPPHCLAALDALGTETPMTSAERTSLCSKASATVQSIANQLQNRWAHHGKLWASRACLSALEDGPLEAAMTVCYRTILAACCYRTKDNWNDDNHWDTAAVMEQRLQAGLLRHIAGNPFRPFPAPPALPVAVTQLAAALEAGEPVAFALRDALLEAGQTELAEHFASDELHPRGCWALDVIGGRA